MTSPGSQQRAVVIGGASGIGLAVVRRLLSRGMSVVAADLNEAALKDAAAEGAEPFRLDISDERDRAALVEFAGETDYLCNSAGIAAISPILEVSVDHWRRMFAVNAEGAFFLLQAFAPQLRPGGSAVSVASMVAKVGRPNFVAYAASKAAVINMTQAFAAEYAPHNIRFNAVCPGIIDTPMQVQFNEFIAKSGDTPLDQIRESRAKAVPLGRLGAPEDVADVINFLLSDESRYMTGQALNVTGGMIAH